MIANHGHARLNVKPASIPKRRDGGLEQLAGVKPHDSASAAAAHATSSPPPAASRASTPPRASPVAVLLERAAPFFGQNETRPFLTLRSPLQVGERRRMNLFEPSDSFLQALNSVLFPLDTIHRQVLYGSLVFVEIEHPKDQTPRKFCTFLWMSLEIRKRRH